MGYQTSFMFLNDAYTNIKENPQQVVDNILDAMNNMRERSKTYSIGNYCNPMVAMKTEHADVPRLYMTYQNCFVEFGCRSDVRNLEFRKQLLKQAKAIIKQEEKEIKKIEESMKGEQNV